jgi:hypothetical protein
VAEGQPWPHALTPLLAVHLFRHIALQLFSAQRFGFDILRQSGSSTISLANFFTSSSVLRSGASFASSTCAMFAIAASWTKDRSALVTLSCPVVPTAPGRSRSCVRSP